jgi:hypothetical protein
MFSHSRPAALARGEGCVWRACCASDPRRPWRRGGRAAACFSSATGVGLSSKRLLAWLSLSFSSFLAVVVVVQRSGFGFVILAQRASWWSSSPVAIGFYAFTLDSEDEGHPLPAASGALSRCSFSAPAQVVPSPAPVQLSRVEIRQVPGGGR